MTSKPLKWLRAVLLIFLALVIIFFLFLALFNWNWAKGFVESKASSATGRTIKINGDLGLSWHFKHGIMPTIDMNNVTITNMATGSAPEMVNAEKINFRFNLFSAFSDQLEFPFIRLQNANVLLEKDKDGNANWAFGSKDEKKNDSSGLKIGQLYLKNSKLAYKDPKEGTDLTVTANSSQDFREQEQGDKSRKTFISVIGDGKYKKEPFKLEYNGASVLKLQDSSEPYPVKTSITVAKTTIKVEGTLLDPVNMQGMDITLSINGASASDLFPLTGVALPPTPPYSVTGKLDYKDKVWVFNNIKGRVGDSDIGGNLSFDKSKARPKLTANFLSKSLNFKDLGGLIGGPPPKDQPLSKLTEGQIEKIVHREESPYVIPDAPLDISRLAAMDADVEYKGIKVISPNLPLDDFYMHVTLDNLVLKVDPVKFGTANGNIEAQLTVNARVQPPQITSNFQFNRLQLGRLFEKLPIGDRTNFKGYIGGVAKLTGTGKSLREMLSHSNGAIGIGMEGGQLSNLIVKLIGLDVAKALGLIITGDQPVAVRCVIGDFAVNNGVMQSRNITIDTANSNIKGEGTINLGTEKMNIELTAHQKDQTAISLKSPIIINGTLKNPGVSIDPGNLILRGGAAAAASVVLTPFVAALAFVEPGLGKDSDCAKMLNEMNQHTGSNKGSSLVPKNANAPVAESKVSGNKKPAPQPKVSKPQTVPATPALPGTYKPGQ